MIKEGVEAVNPISGSGDGKIFLAIDAEKIYLY